MSETIKDRLKGLLNLFSWCSAILLIFGFGFYFGYRIGTNQAIPQSKDSNISIQANESKSVSVEAKKVDGIYFFKINAGDHVCPEDYKVKGTFNPDGGNFYTESNKNFNRIKPDLCFLNEEVARDTAGFIKKY